MYVNFNFLIYSYFLVHGWIYNHTHDSTYTARLGEIGNFITHLKNDKDPNEMVLFFDTGDLIQVCIFVLMFLFGVLFFLFLYLIGNWFK